jgi:MFS family permease
MAKETNVSLDLPSRIKDKQAQVHQFLSKARPQKKRLQNASIIGGSLSALLTAGPALGGKTFAAWLTGVFGLSSPAWQILCGGAALSSLVATISLQLLKSNSLEENLALAQVSRAKLEILEVGLSTGQMDDKQALAEYIRCIEGLAFLKA